MTLIDCIDSLHARRRVMRLTPRMAEGVAMLAPRKAEGRAVSTPRMAEGGAVHSTHTAEGTAAYSTGTTPVNCFTNTVLNGLLYNPFIGATRGPPPRACHTAHQRNRAVHLHAQRADARGQQVQVLHLARLGRHRE